MIPILKTNTETAGRTWPSILFSKNTQYMHNCTVVNYSIKGELVNMANSTNYWYQPVDCSCIAKQVGTHTRRAIWQLI